jgi:hypothetical protein
MRGFGIILVLVATGACAALTSAEPVVFSGTLEDRLGTPVPGVAVVLEAFDNRDVPAGEPPPVAFRAETVTAADGRFEFRFGPPQDLIPIAARNGGLVSFTARAGMLERNEAWSFSFVREIGRERWADTATPIRWGPVR